MLCDVGFVLKIGENSLRVFLADFVPVKSLPLKSVVNLTAFVSSIAFPMIRISQYFNSCHIHHKLAAFADSIVQTAINSVKEQDLEFGLYHPSCLSVHLQEIASDCKVRDLGRSQSGKRRQKH